jgi:phosphoribosyl-AMP cyclohydrolase
MGLTSAIREEHLGHDECWLRSDARPGTGRLQDADSDAVLTLGLTNRAGLSATLETGKVAHLDRRSGLLEVIRAVDGEGAQVREVRVGCDRDVLLARMQAKGKGLICRRGTYTCFTELVTARERAGGHALPQAHHAAVLHDHLRGRRTAL